MSRWPKLPARYAPIVMPLLLSLLMTCLVSLIATVRSVGFTPDLLRLWPGSWALSWLVAFPLTLVVLPLVGRLTAALVETAPNGQTERRTVERCLRLRRSREAEIALAHEDRLVVCAVADTSGLATIDPRGDVRAASELARLQSRQV